MKRPLPPASPRRAARVTTRLCAALAFAALAACGAEAPTTGTSAALSPAPVPGPGAGTGSATPGAAPVTAATTARIVPSLWEVRGPNGPAWLLGTIHVGVSAAEELPPIVWEKLEAARTVVTEVDVRSIDPASVMRLASLPPGETLESKLPPATWTKLVESLEGVIPASGLTRMQPWFVVVTFTASLVPPLRPMDEILLERAAKRGKELVFLETLDEQIGLLQKGIGLSDLEEIALEKDKLVRQLREMIGGYRRGDLEATARVVFDPEKMKKSPEQFELLLFQRNRAWLPEIEKHVTAGGAFIAVGLGHLIGPKGLVELLRAKGYAVERIGGAPGE